MCVYVGLLICRDDTCKIAFKGYMVSELFQMTASRLSHMYRNCSLYLEKTI